MLRRTVSIVGVGRTAQNQTLFNTKFYRLPAFYNNVVKSNITATPQQHKLYSSMMMKRPVVSSTVNRHLVHQSSMIATSSAPSQTLSHSAIGEYSLRFRRCAPKYSPAPRKLKTKSSAKKRFRITGAGKLKRRMAGKQHHAWSKNRAKKNKLRQYKFVTNRRIHKRLATMLNFK